MDESGQGPHIEPAKKSGKVAVIAVHGVGSQNPYVTACELTGLLQRANPGIYSDFAESVLELEVAKPQVPQIEAVAPAAVHGEPKWYVRTRYARLKAAGAPNAASATAEHAGKTSDDLAFTFHALAGVEVDARLARYHTRVLSGTRRAGGDARRVDIYEMYWADLSHLGGWLGKVIGQFYQLLFHVASLGQKTVELAWANGTAADRKHLTPVLISQTLVEWLLAGVLPIGNLALLLAILPASVVLLPHAPELRNVLCAGICGMIAGVAVLYATCNLLWRRLERKKDGAWSRAKRVNLAIAIFAASLLGTAIGITVGRWVHAIDLWLLTPSTFLFIVLSLASGGVLFWFGNRFAGHRSDKNPQHSDTPQKRVSAPIVMMLICALVWGALLTTGLQEFAASAADDTIVFSTLRVAEGVFLLLEITWLLFIVAAWATCVSGFFASIAATSSARIRAAVWTGKVAMFVPATIFVIVNLLLGSVLVALVKKMFPDVKWYESLFGYFGGWTQANLGCGTADSLYTCMDHLLEISASAGFNAFLIFIMAAIVLAMIAMLPSIIHESHPTIGEDAGESIALGNWLDSGFIVARAAGYINLVALLIVLPVAQLLDLMDMEPWLKQILGDLAGSKTLFYMAGAAVGFAGIGVVFRNALFDAFGKVLDIGLDVDNWLREWSIEHNPRGRMMARYLSLLAYICDPKNGYGKLVIVSHSQGTVITADLLRFIHAHPVAFSNPLPTTRLTFGSPLRQLYGLRFPHLYEWARHTTIQSDTPDPAALGVTHWVNGYRSGDYVGRFFWTASDQWKPRNNPIAKGVQGSEFCVGAGAHTHYFDGTATIVGKIIDGTI